MITNLVNNPFELLFLIYAVLIFSSYLVLSVISAVELYSNYKASKITNYQALMSSPFTPQISVLAPAYNESLTIIDNIKALFGLQYPSFEIIIINDGSKDDTLEKAVAAFDMEKVAFAVDYRIESKEIRGVYKSRNKAYKNLTVVDKVNGGKADALNAGINISEGDYFVAIDVDSIIDPDALQKLIKPFLEETKRKVIATGGVIRIANSCVINNGRLAEVNVPDGFLPRCQILEYNRAFLMGRMAWSRLDGLLLISGALGLFDKEVVISCGGYNHNTVGEDMELIVRMRRHMADKGIKYDVIYIPDPLCWTEVPSTRKVLGNQRNRWMRGTIDTLLIHRKLLFNPKYRLMGMISQPYWLFFEWLAPIVEFLGIVYFVSSWIWGSINWPFFYLMLLFVYFFAITFSTYAILFDQLTWHRYTKKRMILKLLKTAWLEPIFYHPMVVYWSLRANFDYFIRRKKDWGKMTRVGFATTTNAKVPQNNNGAKTNP